VRKDHPEKKKNIDHDSDRLTYVLSDFKGGLYWLDVLSRVIARVLGGGC
jgi:hypothetical protein